MPWGSKVEPVMSMRWYWLEALVGRLVISMPMRVWLWNRQFLKLTSWMRPSASLMVTPFQPPPRAMVQPSKITLAVVPVKESTAVVAEPPVNVHL